MEIEFITKEQRSPEWFEARKGRFTGSEINKLMGVKALGKTGESYAFKKAYETVFGIDQDKNVVTWEMQRGIDLEPVAFAKFKEIKELEFIEVEETSFFAKGDNIGASPDGLVGKDAILEIKCPGHEKFFNLVAFGESVIDKSYIDQMQCEMYCTNSKQAHFFNYIIYKGEPMWHEIIIQRDEAIIEKMLNRVDEAVVLRDEYIVQLNNNKQF